MMKRRQKQSLLVTAFGPFGKFRENPSALLIESLRQEDFPFPIYKVTLPVSYRRWKKPFYAAMKKWRPAGILSFGVMDSWDGIHLEKVAQNWGDPDRSDIDGQVGGTLVAHGPPIYEATLPLERIKANLNREGVPTIISLSAGSYLCNALFYEVLHFLSSQKEAVPQMGFIHIPPILPGTSEKNGWTFEKLQKGAAIILKSVGEGFC